MHRYEFTSLSGKRKMRNDIIIFLISEDVRSMHMGPRCSSAIVAVLRLSYFPRKHLFLYNIQSIRFTSCWVSSFNETFNIMNR